MNPPKPATNTVSMLIGTLMNGSKLTKKSMMTPNIMWSTIFIMIPAALKRIIRPMAIKTAKTIPSKIELRTIGFTTYFQIK